ncbi:MAG: putative DNA-binding domain-containing protein [Reyranella sp.]|jgi:hypothetical protein|uniref:HvfC/BufC N-terminal domain-containing protein n=1 Tax=Reyranella sp. TaxID=1929291 RepID=UPI00096714E3|nr:DNA-binding domain-containing protein [Reyranella sp.]MBN9540040.1 putative DNA-binding domain-containing protein [Alphaproteobacteria bacterium]MBR2815846.1 putative DNA-binding domain-containing protein [Reyranella sp.]OJU32058.1 MAG: hypothetical protein BGN99_03185 [Alphaproteobacteria bacterium 65-37]
MPTLRDLQTAFADHICGQDQPALEAIVVGDTIGAAARLRVHRHHVVQSLIGALAATFPTVQAVVGGAFFRTMARAFIAHDLPRQPVLAEYGASFPAFVADYEAAATLPYLVDVGRLDWALNAAFHTSPGDCLVAADLAPMSAEEIVDLSLDLAAGAAIIQSAYPLDRIWRISQPEASNETVDLGEGGACLLVLRRADDATFASLDPAEAAFLAAVTTGRTLEDGAQAGFQIDGAFNLSTTFARLLALQAFAALQHDRTDSAPKGPQNRS